MKWGTNQTWCHTPIIPSVNIDDQTNKQKSKHTVLCLKQKSCLFGFQNYEKKNIKEKRNNLTKINSSYYFSFSMGTRYILEKRTIKKITKIE